MAGTGTKGKQGFASMDPERLKEVGRRGGQSAQRLGKAHTFTQEETRQGGKKAGHAVSRDRAYMAEIGRRGGVKSRRGPAKAKDQNGKE
jgi:general stress protein YciG